MPSQINVQITGRIQNVVFYKRGDKYYARSVPGKVKQTKGTKKRATEFGKASRIGAGLRKQLLPVIPFPADNKMQTRLVSVLFQWLRSGYNPVQPCYEVPFLNNFQFTEGYSITERWKIPFLVTNPEPGMLELKMPAFVPAKAISAPAGTVSLKCNIAVAGCNVKTGIATGGASTSIIYDYNEVEVPEQKAELPVPTTGGSLVVTAIFLEYNLVKTDVRKKAGIKRLSLPGW